MTTSPYTNIGGLNFPFSVSVILDVITVFVVICLCAINIFLIFYVSLIIRSTYRSYCVKLAKGNLGPNAISRISDHYAMLVKSVLLLIISVLEFVTFLLTLFERIFIVIYTDTKNLTSSNNTCAVDRVTPQFFDNFPFTGFLISLSSISTFIFLMMLIVMLHYLIQLYASNGECIRFGYSRMIIFVLFFLSVFSILLLFRVVFYVAYFMLLTSLVFMFMYIVYLLYRIYKYLKAQATLLQTNHEEKKYKQQYKKLKSYTILSTFVYFVFGLFLFSQVMGHFDILFKLIVYKICTSNITLSHEQIRILNLTDDVIEYSVMFSFLFAGLTLIIPYLAYFFYKLCFPLKNVILKSLQRKQRRCFNSNLSTRLI